MIVPTGRSAYRVWKTDFEVTSAVPEVLRVIDRLCHQFASTEPAEAVPIAISHRDDGSYAIEAGPLAAERRPSAERAARYAEWAMMRIASRAEQSMVHLHGSVLKHGDRTLLIPGASGTGKSTFALALVASGFELLADDISFADVESGLVHGLRRALHVHRDAVPLLQTAGFPYRPELHVPGFFEVDMVDRWHRGPAQLPSLILFIERDEAGPPVYHSISHAEAAIELQRYSHNLERQPGGGWRTACQLLERAHCARMIRGEDLVAATQAVRDLLTHLPQIEGRCVN